MIYSFFYFCSFFTNRQFYVIFEIHFSPTKRSPKRTVWNALAQHHCPSQLAGPLNHFTPRHQMSPTCHRTSRTCHKGQLTCHFFGERGQVLLTRCFHNVLLKSPKPNTFRSCFSSLIRCTFSFSFGLKKCECSFVKTS